MSSLQTKTLEEINEFIKHVNKLGLDSPCPILSFTAQNGDVYEMVLLSSKQEKVLREVKHNVSIEYLIGVVSSISRDGHPETTDYDIQKRGHKTYFITPTKPELNGIETLRKQVSNLIEHYVKYVPRFHVYGE